MKRLLVAALAPACLALACAACTVPATVAPPALTPVVSAGAAGADAAGLAPPLAHADRTEADEKAVMAVEIAAKAMRLWMEIRIDSGRVTGAAAARDRELTRRAVAALQVARQAYATANSATWLGALGNALAAINAANLAAGANSTNQGESR